MNRRNFLVSSASISGASFLAGSPAYAAVQIAPTNRVSLFTGASLNFISATSTTIGSVKVLKSTGTTEFNLLLQMPLLGIVGSTKNFVLDAVTGLGASMARISEKALISSAPGQCVAFAKTMIGSTSTTSTWHTGTKVSNISVAQRANQLKPGTMIAYFNASSVYPSNGSGHVAIVLSFDNNGITVVDQNFVNGFALKVGNTSYAASATTLIGVHTMPWTDTSARRAAGEYHIVDLY